MPRFRLLALDIDGTLVNGQGELTAATAAAVRRAVDAGVRVVLVTGRQYGRTFPVAQALGLDTPVVAASGSIIKRPSDHATLFRADFPRDVLAEVLRAVDDAGYDPVIYTDTFHAGYEYHYPRRPPRHAEFMELLEKNPHSGRHAPEMLDNPPEGVFAGFTMGTRAAMLDIERLLEERLPERLYVHVLRSPRYRGFMCEIASAGMTKWSGVLRLADEWGISAAEICAVGDDINDLPMIEGAGLGVAMSNGIEEVRRAADRIAPPNDEDGLVEVVRWVLSEEPSSPL